MGLDISVCKIIKEKNKNYYFRLIDDEGNYQNKFPAWTKQYENTITENWYDWKKYKEQTGIDINECSWHGESYGPDGCFMQLWPNSAGKYPEPEDFKIGKDENGDIYDWDKYEAALAEHQIKVDLEKVPTYKKKIKVLYYKEIGYQRKGLNSKFYSDYDNGDIGYFVWTKSELLRYKRDYCDNKYEYIYPNGDPSGHYIYEKRDFQRNIIDKFEKHCCVTFDW